MTEVADQFTEERSGEVTRIAHWIDGQRVEGTSGRSGPVYNPATGEQTGEVDFASLEEIDAAVRESVHAHGEAVASRASHAALGFVP